MKKLILFMSCVAIGLLAVSCTKEPAAPLSTQVIAKNDKFEITTQPEAIFDAHPTVLLFEDDTLFFSAGFNQAVTWTITIEGSAHPTNHAVKVITGTSDTINPSKVYWRGASDNIYFFKTEEEVTATLTFFGDNETSIELFKKVIKKIPVFDGVLLSNFETESRSVNGSLIKSASDFNIFFDESGADERVNAFQFAGPESLSDLNLPTPIDGKGYIYISGQDVVGQPDPFFIGGFNNNTILFGINAKPEDVFMNFYAHSNGNRTTKIKAGLVGVGGDEFSAERQVTWTGWKLVSIRLSDFVQTASGQVGPGTLIPSSLTRMSIEIHSGGGSPDNPAEIVIDRISFTIGGPFTQSN